MKLLKVIAALMDYPRKELLEHQAELLSIIDQSSDITLETKQDIYAFLEEKSQLNLLDWQSDYESLFERGRHFSLLLFEHVHGESRDRGQAMVDLTEQYKQAGLEIGVRELPDYIPLFLEFLSTQDAQDAQAWLQDVSHILALLLARLEEREEGYASLFSALLEISQADIDLDTIKSSIAKEERDDTPEAIDKVWEEEMVTFGGEQANDACAGGINRPTPAQSRADEMPVQILQPQVPPATASMKE